MYEIKAFPYDGAVDADGHVLEPAWLWEHYLEDRYQERALRIGVDEDGLERLELDGRPSERTTKGFLGLLGAMGEQDPRPGPDRRYMDNIPYGAGDANERLALLEKEHLDAALLIRRLGCSGVRGHRRELSPGYTRAYNGGSPTSAESGGGRAVAILSCSIRRRGDELRRASPTVAAVGSWPRSRTQVGHGHPITTPVLRPRARCPDGVLPPLSRWVHARALDGFGRASQFTTTS